MPEKGEMKKMYGIYNDRKNQKEMSRSDFTTHK